MAYPSLISVVAAVIVREKKYLICQRPLDKRHGGLWEFPGGKLLPGESMFDGARRELHEELDIEVQSLDDSMFTVQDPGSDFMIMFCPVEAVGEPTAMEHLALEWVSRPMLLDYDLAPSDRRFAESLSAQVGG